MSSTPRYLVVTPDGRKSWATLTREPGGPNPFPAPEWLVRHFGLPSNRTPWFLYDASSSLAEAVSPTYESQAVDSRQRKDCLLLVRTTMAAAFDPRQTRLKRERLRLQTLAKESDYVRVEEINVLNGSEPEHYRITFICKGITGIDSSKRPIYGDQHQVEILCDDDFPSDVPRLRWVTPIWHPNIQHLEPKGVCVNKPEWLGGMGLDDLCRLMFEMVQYKNYHAEYTQPYPLDQEVARWVSEYAQPNGIVDKRRKISVDNKPFTRPTVTRFISMAPQQPAAPSRIKLVPTTETAVPKESRIKIIGETQTEAPRPSSPSRIKLID
jgi:ubiquitin-protein ligase